MSVDEGKACVAGESRDCGWFPCVRLRRSAVGQVGCCVDFESRLVLEGVRRPDGVKFLRVG